ncbi:hypothetical protein AB1N83_005602 [Pleurotus pulmonarius]
MAQASKAIIPRDAGGPFGKRIGVSLGGSQGWALRVGAYVTGRTNPSDWLRYSLVVLNCECRFSQDDILTETAAGNDNASASWNPQPVTTTIQFRGMQARYTFPVGVTTLWWYAPSTGNFVSSNGLVSTNTTSQADHPMFNATAMAQRSEELKWVKGTLNSSASHI